MLLLFLAAQHGRGPHLNQRASHGTALSYSFARPVAGGRGVRYFHANCFWSETIMAEWLVGKASDIKEGDRKVVTAGKREIGIFHKGGDFYAYSNTCLHQGGPACEGMMIQNVVDVIDKDRLYQGQTYGDETHFVCPWHGYEYDLKTGECIGDRKLKLRKYEVVKRGDEIYVVA
jgi:nitrite reductase/ring-hydroxylating ferredoxin subunit